MTPVRFAQPSFTELFTPKLVTVLKEGYGLSDLRSAGGRRMAVRPPV